MLRLHFKGEGDFKLLSILNDSALDQETERLSIYRVTAITALGFKAMVHFAAGVIWKASLWPGFDVPLGPYSEKIRSFLLGETVLPDEIVVHLWVARRDARLKNVMWTPVSHYVTNTRIRQYRFAIPGIVFSMYVGRGLPPLIKQSDVRLGKIFSIDYDAMAVAKVGETVAHAREVGSLAKR